MTQYISESVWFLPLALTDTEEGACVAGLTENCRWCRPEPIPRDLVSGPETAFRYDHWVRLRLGPHRPGTPTENRPFLGFEEMPPRAASEAERRALLQQAEASTVDAVFEGDRTLGLIRATVHDVYARRHTGGRSFTRIIFSDASGARFDWVLVEIATSASCAAAGGIEMTKQARRALLAGIGPEPHLTLALGDRNDRFPGRFGGRHPLVVGVHPGPEPAAERARVPASPLFWLMTGKISTALIVLSRLGVLDALSVPVSLSSLSQVSSLCEPQLESLLTVLAKAGLVDRRGPHWQLTGETAALLPMIALEARLVAHRSPEAFLLSGLRGEAHDPLDTIEDESFFETYSQSMRRNARPLAMGILRFARPSPGELLLDLGAADGSLAIELVDRVETLRAVVVDRPALEPHFRRSQSARPTVAPVEFIAHDLRQPFPRPDILERADIVTICNLAHLMPEAGLATLLRTLHRTRPGTRTVLYDVFPGDGPLGINDLLMIDWISGGAAFPPSPDRLCDRLHEAGFTEIQEMRLPQLPGTFLLFRNGATA